MLAARDHTVRLVSIRSMSYHLGRDMNTERPDFKRLLLLICTLISQDVLADPIMTTGQSGSDIFVRVHNFESRDYTCTVQFSWIGNGMPSSVEHNSVSIVPANTINLLIVNHKTALTNVRIIRGPIMICHEST